MTETRTDLLCREGIDLLRNKSFLDLIRGEDGKATVVDDEHAMMCLAACLGLIPPGCDSWKDVLYVRDPVTNLLHDMLKRMESAGILKYEAEKHWYRIIDMETARFVNPRTEDGETPKSKRAWELLDAKLLWPEDLHPCGKDLAYVEEAEEPGKRWYFDTVLCCSQKYPTLFPAPASPGSSTISRPAKAVATAVSWSNGPHLNAALTYQRMRNE